MDVDKQLQNAIENGIREGIKTQLTRGYDNPLDKMITACLNEHSGEYRTLLNEAITECIGNAAFRTEVKDAVQKVMAKTLVQRFGGEIEKQINVLKSDPATRARITIAIEEIVKK